MVELYGGQDALNSSILWV